MACHGMVISSMAAVTGSSSFSASWVVMTRYSSFRAVLALLAREEAYLTLLFRIQRCSTFPGGRSDDEPFRIKESLSDGDMTDFDMPDRKSVARSIAARQSGPVGGVAGTLD